MSIGLYEKQKTKGFWQIDKCLFSYFECIHTVLILDELIFHKSKHADDDGFFYYKSEFIENNLKISKHMRLKCIQKLIDSKILFKEKRGIPTLWYYKLDTLRIDEIIKNTNCLNFQTSENGTPEVRKRNSRVPKTDLPEGEKTELPLYKQKDIINKVVEEEQKPTTTTSNSVKDFEDRFNEDYQKIGEFIKFHKLYGLKSHQLLIFKHFITHDAFLEEVNSISEWKKFPKEQVIDDSNNRTFTMQQKRIVIVSILKVIGVISPELKQQ